MHLSPSGIITDFPDDVVSLSGFEAHTLPRAEPLDEFATDSEPGSPPAYGALPQPATYPPSPSTPMPHPARPKIAPLHIDTPTPAGPQADATTARTPSVLPASLRSPLTRSRSDSAPSSLASPRSRSDRRRPIMLNDWSSLSRLSVYIDSRDEEPTAKGALSPAPGVYVMPYDTVVPRSPMARRSDKVRQLTGDDDAQAFHNAKQALANLPWYLQPTYGSEIKLEYDGSVRAGTLPALVERLTVDPLSELCIGYCNALAITDILPELTQELSYRHAFLTTLNTFTTADEFFDLLIERYEMDHPQDLNADEFEDWKKRKLRPVQTR